MVVLFRSSLISKERINVFLLLSFVSVTRGRSLGARTNPSFEGPNQPRTIIDWCSSRGYKIISYLVLSLEQVLYLDGLGFFVVEGLFCFALHRVHDHFQIGCLPVLQVDTEAVLHRHQRPPPGHLNVVAQISCCGAIRMMSVTRKLDLLAEENYFTQRVATGGSAHCVG
jgi:hypothetical protein